MTPEEMDRAAQVLLQEAPEIEFDETLQHLPYFEHLGGYNVHDIHDYNQYSEHSRPDQTEDSDDDEMIYVTTL